MSDLSILVLEDHDFQRTMAVEILRQLGMTRIHEAADAKSALAVIAENKCRVDVVLCDLKMNGMDGVEFLRDLGCKGNEPAVVIVSAVKNDVMQSVARFAGAQNLRVLGCLNKPLRAPELARVLDQYRTPDSGRPAHRRPPVCAQEEIRCALAADQFVPFFQPKVGVSDRRLIGVEALARWNHPQHGILGPGLFIETMERFGLIEDLTFVIVEKSLAWMANWARNGRLPCLSINLSACMLPEHDFPERVEKLCAHHGVAPEKVLFEITESAVTRDVPLFLEVLSRLRLRGFGLSIDDYGTGFSSLDQLNNFPFTELKIDKSFVANIAASQKSRTIVEATLAMAGRLDLGTVVEGVENQAQWDLIASMAPDMVQGYFVAKPMSGEAFGTWSLP